MKSDRASRDSPLEWRDGEAFFRGLRVDHGTVDVGGRAFEIARLQDAADLLDDPDFAKLFVEDDIAPYGVELWPAAIMLAEHVVADDAPPGSEAIELGTGLGLVSIAAAAKGWRVLATDHDATSLRFAAYNAAINDVRIERFELLDWNNPPDQHRYKRVLAADVLYQLIDHAPILNCVDRLLARDGLAVIADPNRGVADRFESTAREVGFHVDIRRTSAPRSNGEQVGGRIFTLRRAGRSR
ncbi:MAG: class I SAM-dependent methyltransferase [Planctomycetota bacterium]